MYRFYARVSTKDQNLERQHKLFADKVIDPKGLTQDQIVHYADKKSGKDVDREDFQKMLSEINEGDTIVFAELSRLGRRLTDIKDVLHLIKQKGATALILDEKLPPMDDSPMGQAIQDIMITIMGFVAEQERDVINERTRQGREIAIANGQIMGRPIALSPDGTKSAKYRRIKEMRAEGYTVKQIMEETEVSRQSVYNVLNR